MAEIGVDTNILVLHAFSIFEQGRYLRRVWPINLEWTDSAPICNWLGELLASYELVTTPEALIEFKFVAQSRGRLDSRGLVAFLRSYAPFNAALRENHVGIADIVTFEEIQDAWWLCFADTSLVLTASQRPAPLLTLDWPAYSFCMSHGIQARHLQVVLQVMNWPPAT
jgi:hypothetical protein